MHLLGGKSLPAPEPPAGGACRRPVLFEKLQQLLHVGRAQSLVVHEGQLEQPGLQVRCEQQQVVGIDQALFGIGTEEIFGMADDELVERRARGNEHPDRPGPASGAAQLLPRRGDGARIADQHRALQAADVDSELERVGAHHGCDLSAAQPCFYLSPVQRQVAGAVAAHALRRVEARRQVLAQIAEHHLDLQPAAAKDDGLHAGANPGRGDAARLEHRAAAHAEVAVDQWRVVEDKPPFAPRRAVPIDERDEFRGELVRVPDRGRRADECRIGTVEGANAFESTHDVGDLASEKTAIRVELVDDDELKAREEPAPACVMRQQPGVQHVGVGHHDVPAFADRCTAAGRRVAVVGVDPDVDREPGLQRP